MRNAAALLFFRASAEASAAVATANRSTGAKEKEALLASARSVFQLDRPTAEFVAKYFDECVAGGNTGLLRALRSGGSNPYRLLVLRVAMSVAEADGIVDDNDTRVLCSLAELLGLDPNEVYEHINQRHSADGQGEPWWDVLCVSSEATPSDVEVAYRELAKRLHPDHWMSAPEKQRAMASSRMASINLAFEQAKEDIRRREARKAAAAEKARRTAAEAARQAEEARKAAAEAEAAKRAEEQRRAEAAARARAAARAARQEEEDRRAGAAQQEALSVAGANTECETGQDVLERVVLGNQSNSTRSLAPILAPVLILSAGLIALVFQAERTPVSERKDDERSNEVPLLSNLERESGVEPSAVMVSKTEEVRNGSLSDPKTTAATTDHLPILSPKEEVIDPTQRLTEILLELGVDSSKNSDLEQAIIDLTDAIETDPNLARTYFNRAVIWTLLGEYDIAIHDFDRTIAIDPNYPGVHVQRDWAMKRKFEGG